jgi:hypothetical protein
MKKMMILVVVSVFSLSAAAASACDGMKDHEKASADTQAKNEGGKTTTKGTGKTRAGATKSRSDDGTTKS